MVGKYLSEFEKLNKTTENIYDLGSSEVVIILKDGTNLTSWADVKDKKSILYVSENLSNCTKLSRKYQGMKSLKAIIAKNITSQVCDMVGMFEGCESLREVHFYNCDVSNVSDVSWMFRNCSSLEDISGLSNLDVSNVKRMMGMFYGCSALNDLNGLNDWNVSNVISMSFNLLLGEDGMFCGCSSLADLTPLANWDVSKVKDMMYMFKDCKSLRNISALADWDVSSVTTARKMFNGCESLEDISALKNWNVSSMKDMEWMFRDCISIVDVNPLIEWNVSSVENMNSMFRGCRSLVDVGGLINWDVSCVRDMSWMFRGCCSLEDISGLTNWDVSCVKTMKYMFYCCPSLADIHPLSDWDVCEVRDMQYMFQDCSIKDISPLVNWKITYNNNVLGMFDVLDSSEIDVSLIDNWEINLVTRRVLFRSVKLGKNIPQRSIDKAVSLYFEEYGEDNVLKMYNEGKYYHMDYLIGRLNEAFSKKLINRNKGLIEKTFKQRLNPIDISNVPKSIILICDVLMSNYGDKGIDYCMEMFKSKYPMKIDDSDLVHAVLVSKFCENDLNN